MKLTALLVLGITATAMVAACSTDDLAPTSTAIPAPTADALPIADPAQGWFLRTVAPLGDERGLCIDLVGWTDDNVNLEAPVQTHTCKHGWWAFDGLFDVAGLEEGRLEMPYFERCLEAAALAIGSDMFMRDCDGGELQGFSHLATGQIVLASDSQFCIGVPDRPHRNAGGDAFVANGLIVDACSDAAADRQRWVFTEPT